MTDQPAKPTTDDERTEKPNLSDGREGKGNAQRPNDHLDKERESEETIPRKSSLL